MEMTREEMTEINKKHDNKVLAKVRELLKEASDTADRFSMDATSETQFLKEFIATAYKETFPVEKEINA